jgi:hypothetical protein
LSIAANSTVIASEAKQSILPARRDGLLRRVAPRNDVDRPQSGSRIVSPASSVATPNYTPRD